MYNKVIFAGNLTRDPELRYTPQGTAVTTITLAVNTKIKKGENLVGEVFFIDAVVFGKQAENTTQYLSKGSPVLVEGRLRERRWEHEGQQRRKMEVVVDTVTFLQKRDNRTISDSEPEEIPQEITETEPF